MAERYVVKYDKVLDMDGVWDRETGKYVPFSHKDDRKLVNQICKEMNKRSNPYKKE